MEGILVVGVGARNARAVGAETAKRQNTSTPIQEFRRSIDVALFIASGASLWWGRDIWQWKSLGLYVILVENQKAGTFNEVT